MCECSVEYLVEGISNQISRVKMRSEQQPNEFSDFTSAIDSSHLNEFLRNLKTENDIEFNSDGQPVLTNRPRRTQRRTQTVS